MPRHCSAGGCKSRDNRETRKSGITFHRLPKGATRRNIWIANSHRADSWDPQTDFVYFCSKHFSAESFELTGCSGIRRLKDDAFPTVFSSSSTTKCIRARSVQKQEDIHVRSCSGNKELPLCETDILSQSLEEPIVQRSVATSCETHENNPASPGEPSWGEPLSQQEHAHSPPPPQSRPISPSCYMRRLPPPPGFYLSREHSYAQLCPLLWKRRYDQAVDCLEKALRQLHAARRRENRLRSTVLRLRDKQLKHTLSQDGCKNRGTPGGERRRGKEGSNQEDCETKAKSEDTGSFEDRCVDFSGNFLPGTNRWSEEEKGYCFYCERGQVHVGLQVTQRLSKSTEHKDSDRIQKSVETNKCGPAENTKDIQIVRLERPVEKKVETNDPDVAPYQIMVQNPSLPSVSPPVTDEQNVELISSQQKPLVSDSCEVESEAVDLQQQLLWIQDSAEEHVILLPVPGVDGLQNFLMTEGVTDEAQTILVSELDLKRCLGHTADNSRSVTRAETTCDHSDEHSVINSAAVERREDVREKLKEHLEGFHLQLSSEFIN